jgi:hypothetical protein
MDRAELEAQIGKLSRESYADGMRLSARMARDMSDKMMTGGLPAVGGAAALELLAVMIDRVIAARDSASAAPSAPAPAAAATPRSSGRTRSRRYCP